MFMAIFILLQVGAKSVAMLTLIKSEEDEPCHQPFVIQHRQLELV